MKEEVGEKDLNEVNVMPSERDAHIHMELEENLEVSSPIVT